MSARVLADPSRLGVPNTVFREQVEATAGETTTEKGRSARETPSLTLTLTDEASVNTVTIREVRA